ncbi:MAG: ATP-binding cassette domain-containing protein [Candidatus Lokiarchaeota archaeon]|nr:ATP-binding cassette domain-containing protein [Candidatus Harpocratesius repetitus]
MNGLQIKNVFFIYKTKYIDVVALKGVNMTLSPGEITVIMGPSGSGKTTLLNLLNGEIRPSSGQIIYNDQIYENFSFRDIQNFRKTKIGYMRQKENLFNFLTINDNFQLIADLIHRKISKEEIIEHLQKFDLGEKINVFPDQLSQGQQQKIAFLSILIKKPEIILFDEPTGNLDAESRDDFIRMIENYKEQDNDTIFVIVTHDPAFIAIADRVYFLKNGKVDTHLDKAEIIMNKTINLEKNIPNFGVNAFNLTISKEDLSRIETSIEVIQNFLRKLEKKHMKNPEST